MKAIQNTTQTLYWKTVEQAWNQPVLSSNGTFDKQHMAVYRDHSYGGFEGGDAWVAFTNDINNWTGNYRDEGWSAFYLYIYIPEPIRITNYSFYHPGGWGSESGAIFSHNLAGSNDRNNWVTLGSGGRMGPNSTASINIDTTNFYKYYRLYFASGGGGHTDYIKVSNVRLTAVKKSIVPATESDYQTSQVVPAYQMRKYLDKYYGLGK